MEGQTDLVARRPMGCRMSRAEFTKATKTEAFYRCGGKCQSCGTILAYGNIEFHHDKECAFGGSNHLRNCVVLCRNCHCAITNHRLPVIAKSNRQRAKHLGLRSRRSSFQTNRDGPYKAKIGGGVVRRASSETGR